MLLPLPLKFLKRTPMSRKRAFDKLAARLARKAKLNLGATRKVVANDGSVKRKSLDNTGQTRKSIKANVKGSTIEIKGADHIKFLDEGVSGTKYKARGSRFSRSSAPPKKELEKMTRRMKPRDKDGKFVENTPSRRASMRYAVGKSIKEKGTPRTRFLTDAVEEVLKDIEDFVEGLADDIIDELK